MKIQFTRKATAQWKGAGKTGSGTVSVDSKTLQNTPYSFTSRFEDGSGTNPEELIAAAHDGCYAMQLSFLMGEAGFTPTSLDTTATLHFKDGDIVLVALELQAKIEGIQQKSFEEITLKAKEICPISKLLNAKITLQAALVV